MKILSDAQFTAWNAQQQAPVEEIRDGVWAVPLPLPVKNLPWVFSYFIADTAGDLHLIDAGWDSDASWGALAAALRGLGKDVGDIRSLTVTHFHPDHLGMAERIRRASGARVALLTIEQQTLHGMKDGGEFEQGHLDDMRNWGVPAELWPALHARSATGAEMPSFDADVLLSEGELLAIPGREVRVLATPGHTSGELSLHDADAGILYSGDHLLPNQFPGIGLGGPTETNPIADYLGGLDKISLLGDIEVDPGHGYRFTGLQERCEVTRTHHLDRSAEIAAILDRGGAPSVWQVASQVTWTAGWDNLHPTERLSALRQTAQHIDYLERDGSRS
ncbi:MAG TPA: MBL fold metallo-hydrolase [Galbitalea sp.]|jgi:glyoxylase-like metal-dependent hydrolase (beta-lactamase superfamily II)|nr:MBL fold metallo-hydrolase [Galbitalea sp.]